MNSNTNTNYKKMSLNNDVTITQQPGDQSTSPLFSPTYIQGIMREALGYYVLCEFLIGTQQIVTKKGYLVAVGVNFFTLYDPEQNVYILCDIYSVKFVYFTEYSNMDYVLNYEKQYMNNTK